MMTIRIALVAFLVACGGSKQEPTTPNPMSTASEAAPPINTSGPMADATGYTTCDKEIALTCTTGTDGCLSGKTTSHVCVPAEETAGAPCTQEIAKQCPAGQVDACSINVATTHICVVPSMAAMPPNTPVSPSTPTAPMPPTN